MALGRERGAFAAAAQLAEPAERLALDLSAPLFAHAEPASDLFVALSIRSVQAKAADQHLTVLGRQRRQHLPDLAPIVELGGVLPSADRTRVREQVAERRPVLADGLVERRRHPGGA